MQDLFRMRIGLALTGSHCTFEEVLTVARRLLERGARVYPIASQAAFETDTRFGSAKDWRERFEEATGEEMWHTIPQVEPIGPEGLLDVMFIAPCTGNTLAKLANGITDTSVTMAAKAHLRNGRPVVIGISTNDALGLNARNLGTLLGARHVFFVPFAQDAPHAKPTSCVARWSLVEETLVAAVDGRQLQPVLLGPGE